MALRGESGWQTEMTLAECIRYKFDNEIGVDVIFEVGPPDGTTVDILAHKFMLTARSEVFEAMFSSGMAECKSSRVRVEDIDADIFKDLLLYIYSDVVSVDVDTAPSLVYAARKYMLPALVRKCGDCLSEGLTVKNVIRVLETSFIIEDTDLESDCLHLIVEEPRAVLNGTEILAASPQTMEMIIQMDDLSLREIVIYETCIAWAKHQFQCNNSTDDQPTDQQIREILGDLLYLIRFPLMEGTEFLEISEGKNILIQKEKTSILHFLAAKKKGSQFKFSTEPRSASEEVWIERTVACLSALWTSSALVDVIDFTTSQDILLTGVGLYTGHNGADYEVDVEILQSTESLFKKKLIVPSTGDGNQFKVAVNEPIGLSIKAGVIYSVKALSSGDIGHYGRTCKAVCTEGNVTFSFLSNRLSPRTNPIFGQIPRLYFHF